MNVFSNTKKSIEFFLSLFVSSNGNEDSIKQYVNTEYRPIDREGTIYELESKRKKPTTLMFKKGVLIMRKPIFARDTKPNNHSKRLK